jgi:hypothetical protein
MFARLLSADEAVPEAGGLVDALEAEPVAVRNLVDGRLEAVRVVALVAPANTEEVINSIFISLAVLNCLLMQLQKRNLKELPKNHAKIFPIFRFQFIWQSCLAKYIK